MGDAERSENLDNPDLDGVFYTNAALDILRQQLTTSMKTSWMYESLIVTTLDKTLPPPPVTHANPNCGIQAFTALFPRMGAAPQSVFESVRSTGWMNRRSMETALRKVGSSFEVLPRQLPRTGLALIEWTGTWPAEGFWGSDLRYTHWIAMVEGFVYDINWSGWLPRDVWEDVVLEHVIGNLPKATGWRPHTGYNLV